MDNRAVVRKLMYEEAGKKKPDIEAMYCLSKELTQEKIKQITQKEPSAVRK